MPCDLRAQGCGAQLEHFEQAERLERGNQRDEVFVRGLARAYGYAAERVTETAQFEAALLRALAADTGTLIEIPLDPEVITTRGTLASITRAAQARA